MTSFSVVRKAMDVPRRNLKRLKLTEDAYPENATSSSSVHDAFHILPQTGGVIENENEEDQTYEENMNSEEEEETFDEDFDDYVDFTEERNDSSQRQETETSNQSNSERMEDYSFADVDLLDTVDVRLKTYANFVANEGLSNECLDRLDNLMHVLYGFPPIFTKTDVLQLLGKIGQRVVLDKQYFCNRCGRQKVKKRSRCSLCQNSAKNLLETVTLIRCNAKWQLTNFLKAHGSEIIEAHKLIRNFTESFQPGDIRRYKGYRNLVENEEIYQKKEVNLICTLSSDGAVFKRLSRREATPIFLNVEGVNLETKKSGNALCLVALSFSDGGVKKNLVQEIIRKSLSNVISGTVSAMVDKEVISFRVKVMSVIADMKEQALLTSLPNWHHIKGCSRCYTTGRMKARGKVSFDEPYMSRNRSDNEMWLSAARRQDGFTCDAIPEIYKLVPPTIIDIDPFHIRGAGICKQIVSEFLKRSAWKKFRFDPVVHNEIQKSIENIVPFTSESIKTQNFKKLSKSTGREYDKLSVYVCALVGLTGSCANDDFNALMLGWYICLEFLSSVLPSPADIQKLLSYCYELHVEIEKDSLTIKWHNFYNHLVEHQEKFGHLHTTEIYEREHKTMMTSVHFQTTNCEQHIIQRYSAKKLLARSLNASMITHTTNVRDVIQKTMKAKKDKSINHHKPSNNFEEEHLSNEHLELVRRLRLPDNTQYLKRASITTIVGTFVVSANQYWKNFVSTSSSVTFVDPSSGAFKFGVIELIFVKGDSIFTVCRELIVEPLPVSVNNWSDKVLSPTAQKVLECCHLFPTSIGKIIGEQFSIVPLPSLLCPSVIMSFGSSKIAKISMC